MSRAAMCKWDYCIVINCIYRRGCLCEIVFDLHLRLKISRHVPCGPNKLVTFHPITWGRSGDQGWHGVVCSHTVLSVSHPDPEIYSWGTASCHNTTFKPHKVRWFQIITTNMAETARNRWGEHKSFCYAVKQ